MIDAGRIERPAQESRLMCKEALSAEASSVVCRSTKRSVDSMCSTSTIDTLSDTSDEPDGASSSSFDLSLASVGPPPGLSASLRVNAPEFVPSTMWRAETKCPAAVAEAMSFAPVSEGPVLGTKPHVNITEMPGGLRWEEDASAPDVKTFAPVSDGPVLGTAPHVNITEMPGGVRWEENPWHTAAGVDSMGRHLKHHGVHYTAAELLREADRRTQEWRQYCGLAPMQFEDFSSSFIY